MEHNLRVLDWLLSAHLPFDPMPTFADWKAVFDNENQGWEQPIERAIVGGYCADRLAYVFISGYQAALQRLVPDLPPDQIAALCITEEGGGHPRAVKTTLDPDTYQVNGIKSYVSCAEEASILLVAASTGVSPDGLNQIRIAVVPAHQSGVTIEPLVDLDLIPESSHGRAILDCAQAEIVLEGDGYTDYMKPFRMIEDLHVFAAVTAYLFRLAHEFDMPAAVKENLLSYLAGMIPLAQQDPSAPLVRITFSGLTRELNTLVTQLLWSQVDAVVKDHWERDKGLLRVADRVRAQQLENAWKSYR